MWLFENVVVVLDQSGLSPRVNVKDMAMWEM